MPSLKNLAERIYRAALAEVNPEMAVKKHVHLKKDVLIIGKNKYPFKKYRNIYVIGAGKASASMAKAIEAILGDRINDGIVIVKYQHGEKLKKIKVIEAAHPEPDQNGLEGAKRIVNLIRKKVRGSDLVFCLFSGGASALMPLPSEGIALEDKIKLNELLLKSGAAIHEMNAVRKHVSQIKGGQLARLLGETAAVSLILSDVVGDDLSTIASGPTVADHTTFQECIRIVQKYDLMDKLPSSVREHLTQGQAGKIPETPKQGEKYFANKKSLIIGSNIIACKAAAKEGKKFGFNTLILSSFVEGETSEVAKVHLAIAREVVSTGNPVKPPACIISGGETTLRVKGHGKGGRNQEFALHCAEGIKDFKKEILILSLGTDGTDGPTDAAGAMVDNTTTSRAQAFGLKPLQDYLERNDSYNFFKPLGDLVITGPTKTNVMDIRLVLINK